MIIKINESDIIKASENIKKYIKNWKEYTHYKSAITFAAIYLKHKDLSIHFLGKPFGFYGYLAACLERLKINKNIDIPVFNEKTKGVLVNINDLKKDLFTIFIEENKFHELINNILYISPTLFSTLNVAIGYSEENVNKNYNVFLPDSYLDSGEFWEGLNYLKGSKIDNLNIIIDFNKTTKQNQLPYQIDEINDILSKFYNKIYLYDTTIIHKVIK